jgi:hypothetical protein
MADFKGLFQLLNKASTVQDKKDVSQQLSQELSKPRSLAHLFCTFDELGGESFWNNSAAMSAVAVLLTSRSQSLKNSNGTRKQFRQFVELILNPKWADKLQLLFPLFVEHLYATHPKIVKAEFVEKIVAPIEVLLLRGALKPSTERFGVWNKRVDTAICLLTVWMKSAKSVGTFPFSNRLLKLTPFFLHISGQCDEGRDTECTKLAADLRFVVQRFMHVFTETRKQASFLACHLLQPKIKLFRESHFFIQPVRAPAVVAVDEEILHYGVCLRFEAKEYAEEEVINVKFAAIQRILVRINIV